MRPNKSYNQNFGLILLGGGLSASSFWNSSGRQISGMLMPLSSSVLGLLQARIWRGSGQEAFFRDNFTPWSSSPFLSQVFGTTALYQPRPTCMGFWLHCNTAKIVKIKTQRKNSFIPLRVDFVPWPGIKLPWVCKLILAIRSSFCLLTKFTIQLQKVFWDELRGKSFLDCCTLVKQGKDATDEICYQEFDKYFCTKRKTITAWLSTVISLQYLNPFLHLEKDKCWDLCTEKIWAYQTCKIKYNWMGNQIC